MSNRLRLALDAGLLVAILLLANPALTGIGVHEWLGLVLLAPALLHLALNWRWVLHVVERIFDRMHSMSRVNLVADVGLYVSVVAVTLSGVMVMPGVAELLGAGRYAWHLLHVSASNTTVFFALVHAALHWRWILGVLTRMSPSRTLHATAPLTVAVREDCR